ncbi:hypothetical protein ACOKFD_18295 [Flagellimonas sp. S174]|uniref:hypothetical protein n=1 Tax=Flagellimonas sp. S174 TaxID=3410790 RepID=UPI003BF5598B
MKKTVLPLILCLLLGASLYSQIKIGENPQNLDASSVLELESSNRVLVITRVTDAQMLSITPLRGAMVYNTDTQCVHFYTGTEWFNPCATEGQTFSADANVNPDPTIILTETVTNNPTNTNFNFEVGVINGVRNIAPSTIIGDFHITPNSITSLQLGNDSVTLDKLADGLINGQLIQWNGTEWELVEDTTFLANLGEDVTSTNNSITGTQAGASLVPMDLEVNVDGTTIEVDATNGLQIRDNGITNIKLDDDAVGTDEIIDNAVTLAKIADGTVDDNIIQWNAAASQWEEAAPAAEVDGVVGNEVLNATAGGSLTRSGTGSNADPFTLDVTDGGIAADELATDAVTTDKILDANVTLAKIADGTVDDNIIQWNAAASQWEEAAPAAEVDGVVGNEVLNATAGGSLTRSGTGSNADPFTLDVTDGGIAADELATDAVTTDKILDANVTLAKIADGTVDDNIIQWNAAASQWEEVAPAAEVDGVVGNEVLNATAGGSLTRSGTGSNADPFTLDVTDGGIAADELATDAVTTDKILDANVTLAKIADGTVDDNIIQWNAAASQWEEAAPAAEVDGVVGNEVLNATAGGSLTRSGTGSNADPFTLDVTDGGIAADELATDAVTTDKILDANVTLPKLADGTATGELIQWNGTNWELAQQILFSGQQTAGGGTAGAYTINNPLITATSIIQLTVQENTPGNPIMIQLTNQAATTFSVQIYEFIGGVPTAINANWNYTVIAP